jgi:hypothetical protein
LLGVLRVCDIPHALGGIAPRPLTLEAGDGSLQETVRSLYEAASATERLTILPLVKGE